MTGLPLLRRLLEDRRRSVLVWALALAATVALIVVSYGAVEGQAAFDESLADMPESVQVLLGMGEGLSLTSPAGYLNSQLYANFLPILLSVFGIGLGARIIAGDEGDGHLELVLAHPLSRRRYAAECLAGAVLLLLALGAVCALTLVATKPFVGLDIGVAPATAATATSTLLALVHLAVAFGAGAATGSRAVAIAAGAGVTAGGFLLQSLAQLSDTLAPLRWLSPWYWFLDSPAIVGGWGDVVVPGGATVAVSAVIAVVGAVRFAHRDLRHG